MSLLYTLFFNQSCQKEQIVTNIGWPTQADPPEMKPSTGDTKYIRMS